MSTRLNLFGLVTALVVVHSLSCLTLSFAQMTFERKYGPEGFTTSAISVQQTSDGGYIIAGGIMALDGVEGDTYLIKTNSDGDTLWTRRLGGGAASVWQTTDGGYIVAGYTGSPAGSKDVYLIKTTSLGDTLWTRTYGGWSEDFANSVQQTSDGGYIISGATLSFGAGHEDAYLIKTNSNGDTLWTRTYGTQDYDDFSSVQQTTDGGYVCVGEVSSTLFESASTYLVKTNSLGDTIWTRRYGSAGFISGGNSVQQTSDGGYIIVGTDSLVMYQGAVLYLLKTDSHGDAVWTRTYGHNVGSQVRQTSDGGYIVAGTWIRGNRPVYGSALLMKTNPSGDAIWTRAYGSASGASSVQQTSDGGFIMAGYADAYSPNGDKAYVVKTGADGLLDVREDHHTLPVAFTLHQNYPNPFNPSTTIRYELPKASMVRLSVYDILGREVAVLVNERKNAGVHEVKFDASGLSSGVYFYRIQAGDYVASKKMLVLK